MTSPKNKKIKEHLLPGEQIIDCLKFTSFYRGSEFVLTDQRLLVSGYTGSLGPSFTLLRGTMVAGFPLIEFESFVIGTGKRPMLLFTSLALVVAGGVMASFAYTRYSGLVVFAFALFSFLAWTAWPRTFVTVSGGGVKISGRVRHRGTVVFLERLQLAACAAKAGESPAEVAEAAALSGKSAESCVEEPGDVSLPAPGAKKPGNTPEQAD